MQISSVKKTGAFFSFAICLKTAFTEGLWLAIIAGVFSFIMPPFSAAIFSTVSPRYSVCSSSIGPIQETKGLITFVASRRPPSPTSKTAASSFA